MKECWSEFDFFPASTHQFSKSEKLMVKNMMKKQYIKTMMTTPNTYCTLGSYWLLPAYSTPEQETGACSSHTLCNDGQSWDFSCVMCWGHAHEWRLNGGHRRERKGVTRGGDKMLDFPATRAQLLRSWLLGSLGFAESRSPSFSGPSMMLMLFPTTSWQELPFPF